MNVLIVYFSATGNTAHMSEVIQKRLTELGAEVDVADITAYSARQQTLDMQPYQAVIFGAPIHSWRAPRVMREWLRTLDGQGKKCSMFFTYGGFGVHPVHYSTRKILEEQNFTVVSSAEFLASHTFNIGGWQAMKKRPDAADVVVANDYAASTYKRFNGEDSGVVGELEKTEHPEEFLDMIENFRFKVLTTLPTRDGNTCSMCLRCEEFCPTGAISAETGEVEKDKCIACLACVAHCPDNALRINDMSESWNFKLNIEKITEEGMQQKKSRMYL